MIDTLDLTARAEAILGSALAAVGALALWWGARTSLQQLGASLSLVGLLTAGGRLGDRAVETSRSSRS
jgi:hypothetical protein